jgi:hypothetical protein
MAHETLVCAERVPSERLSALRDEALPSAEAARLRAHIAGCAACRARLANFDVIASALRGQRELDPEDRIRGGVRARLAERQRPAWAWRGARDAGGGRRVWAGLAALVPVAALILLFVYLFSGGFSGGARRPNTGASHSPTPVPFSVSGVDLVVTPGSVAGTSCGSTATFTYTATFHIPEGTAGGVIAFAYTVNNGRGSTSASVIARAGQTSQTFTFTSSGTLSPDHTYPGVAEVIVSSPNTVNSPQVKPDGACQ